MAAKVNLLCIDPENKLASTVLFVELVAETSVKRCVLDNPVCCWSIDNHDLRKV